MQSTNSNDGDQTPTTPSGSQGGIVPTEEIVSGTPSNLLVTFLEYCSIAMQVSRITYFNFHVCTSLCLTVRSSQFSIL